MAYKLKQTKLIKTDNHIFVQANIQMVGKGKNFNGYMVRFKDETPSEEITNKEFEQLKSKIKK